MKQRKFLRTLASPTQKILDMYSLNDNFLAQKKKLTEHVAKPYATSRMKLPFDQNQSSMCITLPQETDYLPEVTKSSCLLQSLREHFIFSDVFVSYWSSRESHGFLEVVTSYLRHEIFFVFIHILSIKTINQCEPWPSNPDRKVLMPTNQRTILWLKQQTASAVSVASLRKNSYVQPTVP